MKPEALLYHRIRDNLGFAWDVQRIESTTGRGIPDITASNHIIGEIWIEAKVGTKPRLEPEQFAWMMRRSAFGGRCCIIASEGGKKPFLVYPVITRDIEFKDAGNINFTAVGSYVVPKPSFKPIESADLSRTLYELYSPSRPAPDSPPGGDSSR